MEKKIEPLRHFAPPLPPECNVARAFRVGRRVEEINRTLCRLAWTALCRQHCIGGGKGGQDLAIEGFDYFFHLLSRIVQLYWNALCFVS